MIEIGRFGITIEDFENVFGKEITSNGPILDSWWQVHVHTNRKIRFTFRISNLLSAKTDNIEPNFDVIILSWYKTHKLSTYGSLFWSRKVFEGVHSHVMGSLHFSIKIGAKSEFRTIEKWTKIGLKHVIINFEEKIEWTKIGFSKQAHHVRMNSSKHFSGPKKGPPRTSVMDLDLGLPRSLWTNPLCDPKPNQYVMSIKFSSGKALS